MKTFFDCIPCLIRQTLDAARMATNDDTVHENILRLVLKDISTMDLRQSPPQMAQTIHRHIRKLTGQKDPYRKTKERFNLLALSLLPELKAIIENSQHPVETAVRLAIAGNVIDMGVNSQLQDRDVKKAIDHALTTPFSGDLKRFVEATSKAENILYLTDNAGEIVFDRLLLEHLPLSRVTVAVKGHPVINDATLEDAEIAGITQMVKVIDNGSDAPGTIISDCSLNFRQHFNKANLVIAKGQGNYETLSDVKKDIFFILKAKCPVIARDLGCSIGSMILHRSSFANHSKCSRDSETALAQTF